MNTNTKEVIMRPIDQYSCKEVIEMMRTNQEHLAVAHPYKVALDFVLTKLENNTKHMPEPEFSDYLDGYDFDIDTMKPITNPNTAYKAGLEEGISDGYFLNRVCDRFEGKL